MTEDKTAFVLIPFTPNFNELYDDVIKPVCEDVGYEVAKADSTDTQQNILKDIIQGIAEADLIIADLTNSNPNVFYEAGVAHALGIPAILMTQNIDSIPFDLQPYAMNEYSRDFADIQDLRSEIRDLAGKHLEGGVQFGSPVSDFTDVDIALPATETTPNQSTEAGDETSNSQPEPEKGVLDYAEEAEKQQKIFISSMTAINDEMWSLNSQLEEHNERIAKMKNSQGEASAKQMSRFVKGAARDIRHFVNSVSDDSKSLEESIGIMMDAEESFIDFADPDIEEQRTELRERREALITFRSSVQDAIDSLEGFQQETKQVHGLSRELNQAAGELDSTLGDIISTLTSSDARADRMVQLIERKIQN